MNISYRKCFASGKLHTKTLVDFLVEDFEDNLTASDDDDVALTSVENSIRDTNYAIAKLLDFLVEKEIMSPEYLIEKFLTDGKGIFDIELNREANDHVEQS